MKLRTILLFSLVTLMACKEPVKNGNRPIRFNDNSFLRTKIGNMSPDSTCLSLLFNQFVYAVKDTFSVSAFHNVDVELGSNSNDTSRIKHDVRFWIRKDTASVVSINIKRDAFQANLFFRRGEKLDSNFMRTFIEKRIFSSGLQRYNVNIGIKNFGKSEETQLQIDSWDLCIIKE